MKEGLLNQEVLAMYDVRGIQNYIFRSNHIKEIVGASAIVENIITDGIEKIVSALPGWKPEHYLLDWDSDKNDLDAFVKNSEIQMQVLFIGGGNAYVLFRSGALCKKVNRRLAKYVLEHTYSLNLAVAVVKKSDSYKVDYKNINDEMRRIKAQMPEVKPLGALPFMAADSITGYPLTVFDGKEQRYFCTESHLKRKKFTEVSDIGDEKILDNMVTEKGDNSSLAVIHIDGNNMGKRIKEIMEHKEGYPEAVKAMREISRNIRESFQESFQVMADYIDGNIADRVKADRKGKLYRHIILAGDDITFICNAKVAIDAVTVFLNHTMKKMLYEDKMLTDAENFKKYRFSACAGIAFFNSHFPFSDAYQVAEACCRIAKTRAKEKECRDGDGNIGSFFDYQICTHIKAANLRSYREKNYLIAGDTQPIIMRPYYVGCDMLDVCSDINKRNEQYDWGILRKNLNHFHSEIPRSQAKKLRNSYALGMDEVDKYITFLKSRDALLPECTPLYWYDALEIMDLYPKEENKDGVKDRAAK